MTPAHWAAYNKDHQVMRVLLDGGADHFAFSHMFRLPIDVGGSSRAFEVVDACLDHYYEKHCMIGMDATVTPLLGKEPTPQLDQMPMTPESRSNELSKNLPIEESLQKPPSSVKNIELASKPINVFEKQKNRMLSMVDKVSSDADFNTKPVDG